ncbi:MAG: YcjF family protein [Prochlorotrichaceae cyanobacterium]|jgi:uncharacterized protein (DUF697 family)/predicted GTPase
MVSDPPEHPDQPSPPATLLQQLRSQVPQAWQNFTPTVSQNTQAVTETVTRSLKRLRPKQLESLLRSWLTVDEAKMRGILQQVRAKIPTTEAWLIGKPQAGKSSIVRGLTGISAAVVGQGFRPHTQHTQRYAYPSEELPLLIFTDTVGLGDGTSDPEEILQALIQDLENDAHGARLFILTIKVHDFATQTLGALMQRLRQRYPTIPCLLVVTCLHEVYPDREMPHPPYPPSLESVQRSFAALDSALQEVRDRTVMIDFTLEEDGFEPVFYGLEALRDAITDLLPHAEAQAMRQLLSQDPHLGAQLGGLYREVARRYVLAFSIMAATTAAVPLPFATMPVLTTLQISMVSVLGNLYGQSLTPAQAAGLISTIAGGFLAQAVGRELVKVIPGVGSVISASWAASYTWALGETACVYFGDLLGGKQPDVERIQTLMQESQQTYRATHREYAASDEE